MPARPLPDKFQVAFSFAGEQRDLVRSIAEAVEKELGWGQVFFDEWYEHYLPGGSADHKLQQIYADRCHMVVICVSGDYGRKPWTLIENEVIRARWMKAQASSDERDQLAVLPIRVGDGEVPGIHANTIALDVRARTVTQVAELFVNRLSLILPSPILASSTPGWPDSPPTLDWPMADHGEVRQAFATLLTNDAPWRYLPVVGPSEVGKSHITNQMLSNAVLVPGLASGRLDFKGTANLDNALGAFVTLLGVEPPAGTRLSERLRHVVAELTNKARLTLLIFDTYELASGEDQDWLEKQLLLGLVQAPWLRVVVAGQRVPYRHGAPWAAVAAPAIQLQSPQPEDWLTYGLAQNPDIDLDFVRRAHACCRGKASLLAGLLGPAT